MKDVRQEDIAYFVNRSCLRKQNLNEDEANRIIDEAASDGLLLYYYKCMVCGSHHLTSQEPEQKKHLQIL